jgi:16S rRNA U516 pseudouridylate synthase RsuA-like enzyme
LFFSVSTCFIRLIRRFLFRVPFGVLNISALKFDSFSKGMHLYALSSVQGSLLYVFDVCTGEIGRLDVDRCELTGAGKETLTENSSRGVTLCDLHYLENIMERSEYVKNRSDLPIDQEASRVLTNPTDTNSKYMNTEVVAVASSAFLCLQPNEMEAQTSSTCIADIAGGGGKDTQSDNGTVSRLLMAHKERECRTEILCIELTLLLVDRESCNSSLSLLGALQLRILAGTELSFSNRVLMLAVKKSVNMDPPASNRNAVLPCSTNAETNANCQLEQVSFGDESALVHMERCFCIIGCATSPECETDVFRLTICLNGNDSYCSPPQSSLELLYSLAASDVHPIPIVLPAAAPAAAPSVASENTASSKSSLSLNLRATKETVPTIATLLPIPPISSNIPAAAAAPRVPKSIPRLLDYTNAVAFVVHKPVGCLSSSQDSAGSLRGTVYDVAGNAGFPSHIGLVGRLDAETSGIMVFSNDGRLYDKILHPVIDSEEVNELKAKTYVLSILQGSNKFCINNVDGSFDSKKFELEFGASFGFQRSNAEFSVGRSEIRILRRYQDSRFTRAACPALGWVLEVQVRIYEGKHQQIRRMAKRNGYVIIGLVRTSICGGLLQLSSVPTPGQCRWLTAQEKRTLYAGFELKC